MKREILFRGKKIRSDEWAYGDLITGVADQKGMVFIWQEENNTPFNTREYNVIPETVGQFTGLTDKNGTKIFEGDIVEYAREEEFGRIAYHENEAMFVVEFDTWLTDFDHMWGKDLEIIGNIHDNPELLK